MERSNRVFSKSLFLLFLLVSCIDRINFDGVRVTESFPVVIDGFISSAPGPYTITVSKAFDIESSYSLKEPYPVKRLTVADDRGQSEDLEKVGEGVYQLSKLQGEVGRVYTLRVELFDGRVYESVPDTLLASGSLDSIYYAYQQPADHNGFAVDPQFAVRANSMSTGSNNRYMWQQTITFKANTRPENDSKNCYFFEGKCNFAPPCSGYRNIGITPDDPEKVKLFPCMCCTCWYNIYNPAPVLSDELFMNQGNYRNMEVGQIPISGWTFMEKVRVEVSMKSMSKRSFSYFKSIRDQKSAVNSLFQPITGKIPLNFIQLTGQKQDVYGIFYATGMATESFYITRSEVPYNQLLPTPENYNDLKIGWVSCLELFPNATTVKPDFWKD